MKKIVNVNVGGFAFVIEEQAYEKLNAYLSSVKRNLGTDVDADEVMADIELRIAELFKEDLKSGGKEVVEEILIAKVITIMGKPEDYGTGEPVNEQQEQNWTYAENNNTQQRRLFRDPDQKTLGGVASGLANYFGWDPLAVRIIFVLLVLGFGIGIPLYIILWILVPEAKTTNDRLRMQGKPITVDSIKQGFNDFKNDVRNIAGKDGQKRVRTAASSFGNRVEGAFSDFGRAVGKIIGVIFLVIGLVIFASLIKYLLTGTFSFPENASEELFFGNTNLFFDNPYDYYLLFGGACVLALMILWGLLSAGIELLFKVKLVNKPIKFITGGISVVALVCVIFAGINLGKNFTYEESVEKQYDIPSKDSLLTVNILKDEYFSNRASAMWTDEDELIKVSATKITFGYPRLAIKLSESGRTYLEVRRSAAGPRGLTAIENAEAIEYPVQVDTGSITLPSVFSTSVKNKFRHQNVVGVLYVPAGTIIQNKHNMKRIFDKYDSYTAYDELNDAGAYRMTKEGLVELK
ncbi:MAG TPA: PspC domain-containing protein [Flavobacteriales bacterium]|nr:PspC domain-containing protein [Flavobacteriales bacterium]